MDCITLAIVIFDVPPLASVRYQAPSFCHAVRLSPCLALRLRQVIRRTGGQFGEGRIGRREGTRALDGGDQRGVAIFANREP
ncbi:hypothetical protein [Sphingomonas sp. VDB2]|uniref:hypothetical protein n=1 Tax=Sphingomonas sp. VDB2 TaxID=3228751 RepID=UPI003A7FF0A6